MLRTSWLRSCALSAAILAAAPLSQAFADPAPQLTFTPEQWALAEAIADEPDLARIYGARKLQPIFSDPALADELKEALRAPARLAPSHGLPSERYRVPEAADGSAFELAAMRLVVRWVRDLSGGALDPGTIDSHNKRAPIRPDLAEAVASFVEAPDKTAWLSNQGPDNPDYRALQAELAPSTVDPRVAEAPLAPERLIRPGTRDEGIPNLRARLAALGHPTEPSGPADLYDEGLKAAVRAYQAEAGLMRDGIFGPSTASRINGRPGPNDNAIARSLERLRWLGDHDLAARHVWVNLPEYRARIREQYDVVFDTRVVIGKPDADYQTPEFSDEMEFVVVNPRWNVPRSITVNEYLPRLQANPNAVSHLDVVDSRGNVVPRGNINFNAYTTSTFPYRMRQKPSEDNALGIVKFIFPNRWNIYLHDTPSKGLFSHTRRAYSHGCVRVGDPVDLATELLSPQSDAPRAMFDRARATGKERWLKLEPKLPVHLVYFTAFPDENGKIRRFPDIYGRDAALTRALNRLAEEGPMK